MELMYLEAMQEHGLKKADLPEDAQTGIEQIDDVIKGMKLLERSGKTIPEKTFRKLKAMDKWVYYEILDMLNETEENDDQMPYSGDEILEEVNEQMDEEESEEVVGEPSVGQIIDEELSELYKAGNTEIKIDDLKSAAKKTYEVIFEGYEDSGENGVETSNFRLIETNEYVFTLTKK